MNFGMRNSQTRMNKIHCEFHPTIKNKFCTDEIKGNSESDASSKYVDVNPSFNNPKNSDSFVNVKKIV